MKIVIENTPSGRKLNGIEIKHIPSAQELADMPISSLQAPMERFGTSFDNWREEREMLRRFEL